MRIVLDASKIRDRHALHRMLAEKLCLPEWYGGNLDALHDCLTDMAEPVELEIIHAEALDAALGGYARAFYRTLSDSAAENACLHVCWNTSETD